MKITREMAQGLLDKMEKILGRAVYLYDENGAALNGQASGINFLALQSMQDGKEIVQKREDKFFSCLPIAYEDENVGAVCIRSSSKEEAKEFSGLAKGFVEVLLYEEFLVKNMHIANDLRSDFIKEILMGTKIKTTEEAIEQGDIIGVNLRFKYAVMIFKIESLYDSYVGKHKSLRPEVIRTNFQGYLKEIENELLCSFEGEIQSCIVYIGEGRFVMLKEIKKENIDTLNSFEILKKNGEKIQEILDKKFPDRTCVSVGQYYPGLSGLRKSYEDAKIAMKIGEKVISHKKVFHILDVAMFVGLLGEVTDSRKNELSYQVLRKLYDDSDLLKTTDVFLASGMNLTEAAKKLHLHRNTLIYRLKKVKDLVGLDPTRFYDALQIKLGLMSRPDKEVSLELR